MPLASRTARESASAWIVTSAAIALVALAHPASAQTTPPGPPTGLVAAWSGSTITLTWVAPATGGAVTTYVIEAGSAPGVTDYAQFATDSTATRYSQSGVGAGVFYIRIRARNDGGTSAASNEVRVRTPVDGNVPLLLVHGFCVDSGTWDAMTVGLQPSARFGTQTVRLYYDGTNVRNRDTDRLATEDFPGVDGQQRLFTIDFFNPDVRSGSFLPIDVAERSIDAKALELAQVIAAILRMTGYPQVIVAGHSMGGLVARAYVQGHGPAYAGDVSAIATWATPHKGSTWANVTTFGACFTGDSLNKREMVPGSEYLQFLNRTDAAHERAGTTLVPEDVVIRAVRTWMQGGVQDVGDGVVSYDQQSLATIAPYPSRPHAADIPHPIAGVLPPLLHLAVITAPESIALMQALVSYFDGPRPPAAPTGFTARDTGNGVALQWTAPARGPAPASYVIQAGSAPGLSDLADFDTGSAATGYFAAGVAPGIYYVRVLARNRYGTSIASNEARLVVAAGLRQ